jgi:zona occludens toxin
MINGLEGIPGSGKSYEAVVFHVLPALQRGRKVITNLPLNVEMFAALDPAYRDLLEIRRTPQPVRGKWDSAAAGRDEPAFKLFEDGQVYTSSSPLVTLTDKGQTLAPDPNGDLFGSVWDYWTDWKGPDGNGPLFVIDECHVALPAIGTKAEVVQWFKIHRHFNCDVLLMTQSFRDMCQPIARLVAMLVRVRKADILGDKNSYVRKVHGGLRGAVISTEKRKYLPQMFPLYKSHTQGNAVAETSASDVTPLLVKFNRFKWAWIALTVGYGVWAFWPHSKPARSNHGTATTWANGRPIAPDLHAPGAPGVSAGPVRAASAPAAAASAAEVVEPLAGKAVHIIGSMTMHGRVHEHFAVSMNGQRVFDMSAEDLKRAGYTWRRLADCAGTLTYGTSSRAVTCDAPVLAQGSENKPVVLAERVPVGSTPMPGAAAPGAKPDEGGVRF